MQTSSSTRPVAQVDVRTPRLRGKQSFARMPKRGAGTRACHFKLPRRLWDRIILLMFISCLIVFLHAFFGFGDVDEGSRVLNDTFVHPHALFSIPSPWNWHPVGSNGAQRMRTPSATRMMVDWHGNYELLPSTASAMVSPASIPQDAFPDPTPVRAREEGERALDKGSLSMTTNIPAGIPLTFYGVPYDPFRLVFEDSDDEGGYHGLYPVAGTPRTARTRRFGRCFPGETCS